jgi:hypothetical protein
VAYSKGNAMRRKYLVVKDVRDSKGDPSSYIVFGVVELDERAIPAVEAVTLDEQTAQAIRETMRDYTTGGRKCP